MKQKIKLALLEFVSNNNRFTLNEKSNGFYLNKKDGNYACIGEDLSYKQPKGASWRSDINSCLEKYGLSLK